jgi:hypothetical protein
MNKAGNQPQSSLLGLPKVPTEIRGLDEITKVVRPPDATLVCDGAGALRRCYP